MKISVLCLILAFGCTPLLVTAGPEDDGGAKEMIDCLATHNKASKFYRSQSVEGKYKFIYEMLSHSYGPAKADEFAQQKEKATSNVDHMDSFFNAVIAEITETCVKKADKTS